MGNIIQQLKALNAAKTNGNQALLRTGGRVGNNVVEKVVNSRENPDTIIVTLKNTSEFDRYFSLLQCASANYAAYTTPGERDEILACLFDNASGYAFKVQNEGGMTGFRSLVKQDKPYIVGMALKVASDSQVGQFSNPMFLIETGYKPQTAHDLTTDLVSGSSSSSFEQQTRIISKAFVIDHANDIVIKVGSGVELSITLNVAKFDHKNR